MRIECSHPHAWAHGSELNRKRAEECTAGVGDSAIHQTDLRCVTKGEPLANVAIAKLPSAILSQLLPPLSMKSIAIDQFLMGPVSLMR